MTLIPFFLRTSIASKAGWMTRPLNIHPTKNPTVALTSPSGSITSGTRSRKVGSFRSIDRPVFSIREARALCAGRESPLFAASARSFSIAFRGVSISFGQTSTHLWQVVQEKSPLSIASRIRSPLSRGSRLSLCSCRMIVGPL